MAGVGDEHWTDRPKTRLEKELGKEVFCSIFNHEEGIKVKKTKGKSKTKLNEKNDWEYQFTMKYRQKNYCAGGNTPETAEDAVCEAILRDIDGISVPNTKYSCTKPDSRGQFQKFKDKNKWKNPEKLQDEKASKLHYTWESASSSWFSLCIKQPPFKKTALAEYFHNRSYRFYKAHGAKDNHFKSRCAEMFLEEYHNQEKLLKQEQNRNYQQQQDEREEDLTELQIEENFTFLGIKNRQNRFIKVRPSEFADITKLEKWNKYFEKVKKEELFEAKIEYSTDECKYIVYLSKRGGCTWESVSEIMA